MDSSCSEKRFKHLGVLQNQRENNVMWESKKLMISWDALKKGIVSRNGEGDNN